MEPIQLLEGTRCSQQIHMVVVNKAAKRWCCSQEITAMQKVA